MSDMRSAMAELTRAYSDLVAALGERDAEIVRLTGHIEYLERTGSAERRIAVGFLRDRDTARKWAKRWRAKAKAVRSNWKTWAGDWEVLARQGNAEIVRLREALEWYGKASNYRAQIDPIAKAAMEGGTVAASASPVIVPAVADNGQRAREALAQTRAHYSRQG